MAIGVSQFPIINPTERPSNLTTGLNAGMNMYQKLLALHQMPQQEQQRQQQQQLQNQMSQAKLQELAANLGLIQSKTQGSEIANQNAPQMNQLEMALKKAQIMKAMNPDNELNSQMGKEFSDMQKMKQKYGESSPEYQQFQEQVNFKKEKDKILNESRKKYMDSATFRSMNALEKDLWVSDKLKKGYTMDQIMEAGPQIESLPQTPENKEKAQEQYYTLQSNIMKKNMPVAAQKAAYAAKRARAVEEELIKSWQDAKKYFGPEGRLLIAKDKFDSFLNGNKSGIAELDNFRTQLKLFKAQVGELLHTPAHTEAQAALDEAFNVNQWYSNAQTAEKRLDSFFRVVNNAELGNFAPMMQMQEEFSGGPLKIGGPTKISSPVQSKENNEKASIVDWYLNASPEERAAYKTQMGGNK